MPFRGRIATGLRWLALLLSVPVALLLLGWGLLLASRAQLDGQRAVPGLGARVSVERDALGVPTVRASSRTDLARATGFLHAQDRFFQMDLLRRNSAGDLAALLGPGLVEYDLELRRHGFRATATAALETLPREHRAVLEAYTAGVNAGLQALKARPPEYLLLSQKPAPWQPVDSLLVGLVMFERLQDSSGYEDRRREVLGQILGPEALAFFDPDGTDWEAPLDGSEVSAAPIPATAPAFWRRTLADGAPGSTGCWETPLIPGSNSWGVGGDVTGGGAVVANDMHLDLGLPNIWYRMSARWVGPAGEPRQFDGVMLPGTPLFIVGSNGHVAWAFTNGTLDTTDLVDLELDPNQPNRYRTPEGWKEIERQAVQIEVAGEAAQTRVIDRTIWGPIAGTNALGRLQAVSWVAHRADAVNLHLMDLESVTNTAAALAVAPRCGLPVQNLLVGDRSGDLAWTLIGRLPRRVGFDGRQPVSWADGTARWDGWRMGPERPVVRGSRLWTANNRMLGTAEYRVLGPHLADLGARARMIRDDLKALAAPDETGLFSIYRDDRAQFLERWRELMLRTLDRGTSGTNGAAWSAARRAVMDWGGRAAVDSVGYRLVRAFRFKVGDLFFEPLTRECREVSPGLGVDSARWERPLWTCLEARPPQFLNPRFTDYDALLRMAVEAILVDLERQGLTVEQATWGQRNTVRIQHPLSGAVPKLASWLDLPPRALSGDDHMPKVQGIRFGASERMVVSPGREERGFLQMPGGQSGHFLSPFYRAGSTAWEEVEPTPLLPGPVQHRLELVPVAALTPALSRSP